ncbi:MAG: hypothetical protein REI93_04210, partial [Pedobacter sp.]|nr:hypothetical protein [Pedobacter sp.]
MKKVIYSLVLLLVVAGGLVLANRGTKSETPKKPKPRVLTAAEKQAALKNWEASPDGIKYKQWEASPVGKKVYASEAKI